MSIIVFVKITILLVASHPENCRVGSEKLKAAQLKIEKLEITPNEEIKTTEFVVPEA